MDTDVRRILPDPPSPTTRSAPQRAGRRRITMPAKKTETGAQHNMRGNCWNEAVSYGCKDCGTNNLCDVCHEHDEPRGSCSECPPCPRCKEEQGAPKES